MLRTSLESQLRYRKHGYAWARRVIAGLTVCLVLITGIVERDTLISPTVSVTSTPAPTITPAEPECPRVVPTRAHIRILIPKSIEHEIGRAHV